MLRETIAKKPTERIQMLGKIPNKNRLTLDQTLRKLKIDGYLYIPSNKEINVLGGKAYIENVWINLKEIIITFKDLPDLFKYSSLCDQQEYLKKEFYGTEAIQCFIV